MANRPALGARAASWTGLVLFGWWWAWRRLRHTYLFYDEWAMVDRVVHSAPLDGMTTGFNTHLWFLQDPIYRLQGLWFGFDDHWLVVALFLVALAGFQLVLAALFERAGMAVLPAALTATLLVYLGTASQNFTFAIQVSPTVAAAAAFTPGLLVIDRRASRMRDVGVGLAVLLATLADSGFGVVGLVFAAVLISRVWSWRHLVSLVPAALVLVWWFGLTDQGPAPFPSSAGHQVVFAARLLIRSAGALVGGGAVVGVAVLVVFVAAAAAALRWGTMPPGGRALAIGALVATVVVAVGISHNRAGIPGLAWRDFNRYLQNVGVPLVLAAAPGLVAVGSRLVGTAPARRRWGAAVACAAIAAAFALSVPAERDYAADFLAWNGLVRQRVEATAVVLATGCPEGTVLHLDAQPAGGFSPQVTAQLVLDLMGRGLLHVQPGVAPDPALTAELCTAP
ncbi:MAG: hypothetical protein H6513_10775 [Acidimicrobiaceae bacterium]|nr:hypothetical protein [Ilumatobacter sp.]MCB9381162.1 hypothetical protein [Acidimicrobiaceae bacterium]MCO5331108.1 hypothetical protein [Ilumatobacteraceae bacterium]